MPGLILGQTVPDFEAKICTGGNDIQTMKFHEWLGGSWAILFSHPADFTPVCTTELSGIACRVSEFKERGVKLIALSCDSAEQHKAWVPDINEFGSCNVEFPIIADPKRDVANLYGMMDPVEKDAAGLPLTARAVFMIGPDKKLKLSLLYPATTGRNVDELLRVLDSLKLTAEKKVATPVNWKQGEDCIVLPNISQDEAKALFPKGVTTKALPSKKEYLRYTPQP